MFTCCKFTKKGKHCIVFYLIYIWRLHIGGRHHCPYSHFPDTNNHFSADDSHIPAADNHFLADNSH